MRNQWLLSRMIALLLLLSLSMAACQPIATPAVQTLKPGDKIGEMVVAQGPVPFDLEIPPYLAFCNANPEIDPDSSVGKPGVYTVECVAPPLPKMAIGFGWVTNDETLLNDQWPAINTELYVNGQFVDQAAFGSLDADVPINAAPGENASKVITVKLRTWNVVLENLTPGQVELRYVWRVMRDLVDEMATIPQGVYDITYKITVDAALAVEEGTPAPVELIRQPVEFVRKIDTSAQKIQNSASLAVDSQGNVYVTDSSDTPRVLKYDNLGNFVLTWGEPGSGEGQFTFIPPNPDAGPTAGFVAVDAEDNVYVSDAYNFRVQKFDANGNFLLQFGSKGSGDGQFDEPTAGPIYVDSQGNIYVSTFPRVQKFDAAGNFLAAYGTAGTEDGQFNGAALGTIDREGNLYVADFLSVRVQKLDASGQFLLKWGSAGTAAGQFTSPVTIVQDKAEKLYVADNSDRIQIFDTDGNFLGQWRETGGGNPPLTGAIAALAIDSDDNIYVSDTSPSIYVFHPR